MLTADMAHAHEAASLVSSTLTLTVEAGESVSLMLAWGELRA